VESGAGRLRGGAALRAVFSAGSAAHGATIVVRALRRCDDASARVTVVAGCKVGGAVRRNRAKRRLRAALAEAALPHGTDFVVVARAAVLKVPFPRLVEEVAAVTSAAAAHALCGER
jgi:ribonuclease P protein component